jgi:hypothetical protein
MGKAFRCGAILSSIEIFMVLSWTIKGYFQSFKAACRIATFYWRRTTSRQFIAAIGRVRQGVARIRAALSRKVARYVRVLGITAAAARRGGGGFRRPGAGPSARLAGSGARMFDGAGCKIGLHRA